MVFTDLNSSNSFKKNLPIEILIDYDRFGLRFGSNGLSFLGLLLKNEATLISGLSRGFFKRQVFEKNPVNRWIQSLHSMRNLDSTVVILLTETMLQSKIFFMKEELVQRGYVDWTADDLELYRNICRALFERIFE